MKSANQKVTVFTLLLAGFLTACNSETNSNNTPASASVESSESVEEVVESVVETTVKPIDEIMSWWPGDYNNKAQIEKLRAEGKPVWLADDSGAGGHIEVESHYRMVDFPEIGDRVLYVEELKHGDPDNIFRQRFYTLTEDESTGSVRVKLWYFNDKKKYVGAWKDLNKLSGITAEELFPLKDDCDLLVEPQGGKYHMPMGLKQCVFGDDYFSYQVLLGPESFWFRDKINNLETDEPVSVAGGYTYHELDRVN